MSSNSNIFSKISNYVFYPFYSSSNTTNKDGLVQQGQNLAPKIFKYQPQPSSYYSTSTTDKNSKNEINIDPIELKSLMCKLHTNYLDAKQIGFESFLKLQSPVSSASSETSLNENLDILGQFLGSKFTQNGESNDDMEDLWNVLVKESNHQVKKPSFQKSLSATHKKSLSQRSQIGTLPQSSPDLCLPHYKPSESTNNQDPSESFPDYTNQQSEVPKTSPDTNKSNGVESSKKHPEENNASNESKSPKENKPANKGKISQDGKKINLQEGKSKQNTLSNKVNKTNKLNYILDQLSFDNDESFDDEDSAEFEQFTKELKPQLETLFNLVSVEELDEIVDRTKSLIGNFNLPFN